MKLAEFYRYLSEGKILWNESTETKIKLEDNGLFILNHDFGFGIFLKTASLPNTAREASEWELLDK